MFGSTNWRSYIPSDGKFRSLSASSGIICACFLNFWGNKPSLTFSKVTFDGNQSNRLEISWSSKISDKDASIFSANNERLYKPLIAFPLLRSKHSLSIGLLFEYSNWMSCIVKSPSSPTNGSQTWYLIHRELLIPVWICLYNRLSL